ncbi:MAG: CDP-glucose 4,6-dehydratase, partial [Candidatus Eremiobacteraeota bacterium]|nr:CDP-glucose 4,6-dehydratase [Candidatus Eremiobacteraeota bacterium]
HTGFKGSWLAHWLVRLGADVYGYALAPETDPSPFGALDVGPHVASAFGDVRDAGALGAAMRAARPEIVLHLAAQPLVLRGYREPADTFDVNVMGTVRVLDAVRDVAGVAAVVVVTTDKVYAERDDGGAYSERDRLGGIEPYGASKACAEIVTDAYRASYFRSCATAVATARAGNVIGGGDWSADRLIPDLVAALASGRRFDLRHPHATRPWQHVLDPLAGYLVLAERLALDGAPFERAWNFGPQRACVATAGSVVTRFERAWGTGVTRETPAPGPREAPRLALDASDARRLLPWSPRLGLDEAIRWTAEWYRGFTAGMSGAALAHEQLERYVTRESASVPAGLSASATVA